MSRARLVTTHVPRDPQGIAVLLHGGASRADRSMVSPAQLSVLRMVPLAGRIARAGRRSLVVVRLLNSHRGWDSTTTPVMDATWALDRLADRFGPLPSVLVGHSLGGRAALLAATHPMARGAVALNPWLYPTDGADLTGRRVLVVHGTEDRVAPIDRAEAVARRLAATAEVDFVAVPGGRHAMLRHGRTYERRATAFVIETLVAARRPGH
jgi:alpha-beta hydrolase superfamily lysophospholipase